VGMVGFARLARGQAARGAFPWRARAAPARTRLPPARGSDPGMPRRLQCCPVPWNPRGGRWPDYPRGLQDVRMLGPRPGRPVLLPVARPCHALVALVLRARCAVPGWPRLLQSCSVPWIPRGCHWPDAPRVR